MSPGVPAGDGGTDQARRLLTEATALIAALATSDPGHDGPQCRGCPLCRALAVLQRVRPEAVEHLAGALGDLAVALREMLVPVASPGPAPGSPEPRSRPAPVEHIDITE